MGALGLITGFILHLKETGSLPFSSLSYKMGILFALKGCKLCNASQVTEKSKHSVSFNQLLLFYV